jgi:cytochrome oxidase Cu insertion factor (SCO1/SenC/PrrC family)
MTLAVSRPLSAGITEMVSPQRGTRVPAVHWRNESGAIHGLSEFAGYPVILLPIYTRCQATCPTNVASLKQALAEASADPSQFRVLLFSFDPTDTPEVLTQYRVTEKLPLGWSLGTGSPEDTEALLESIGFQYGQAGKEFTHPNVLTFLNANLQVAKWIYGSHYSGREVDAALRVARGENDWLGRNADVVYALSLFALSLVCVALVHQLLRLIAARRSLRTETARLS